MKYNELIISPLKQQKEKVSLFPYDASILLMLYKI